MNFFFSFLIMSGFYKQENPVSPNPKSQQPFDPDASQAVPDDVFSFLSVLLNTLIGNEYLSQ
tara:strand:+ start:66 stop:251 length:186 start_codon:yes stop_codon:yes gene_type:complete